MSNRITKVSIELCQYLVEVGIRHGFWIGKIFDSELIQKGLYTQIGPFDSFQEAMRGVNAQIMDRTILKEKTYFGLPKHYNCRCSTLKTEKHEE